MGMGGKVRILAPFDLCMLRHTTQCGWHAEKMPGGARPANCREVSLQAVTNGEVELELELAAPAGRGGRCSFVKEPCVASLKLSSNFSTALFIARTRTNAHAHAHTHEHKHTHTHQRERDTRTKTRTRAQTPTLTQTQTQTLKQT